MIEEKKREHGSNIARLETAIELKSTVEAQPPADGSTSSRQKLVDSLYISEGVQFGKKNTSDLFRHGSIETVGVQSDKLSV